MKKIIVSTLFLVSFLITNAQINVSTSQKTNKNWRIGAGVGLNFGNNGYFGARISPSVGYYLGGGLEVGATAGYSYTKDDDYKQNLFSVGAYTNYFVIPQFFARAHYEHYMGEQENKHTSQTFDIDEDALWLGGGYENGGMIRYRVGIMYNVLYDEDDSIFSNAVMPFAGISVAL